MSVIEEVAARREEQDRKHGGPAHDDVFHPDPKRWTYTIRQYAAMADACADSKNYQTDQPNLVGCRAYLIDCAALAVAAAEMIDRKGIV